MWQSLFDFQIPAAEKIFRTVAVYLLILIVFRVGGRRSMAQMNMLDFTVMLLLSNVVQNAVIGADNSFIGGALGAVTLMVANEGIDYLAYRFPMLSRWIEGKNLTLVRDGKPVARGLRRLRLHPGDLDHAIRLQNGNDISDVSHGEMDNDGRLVISLRKRSQPATHADVAALNDRLDRIEKLLSAR
ncbi:MAG: YetF domain-containing protein [Nakamurella sp.]